MTESFTQTILFPLVRSGLDIDHRPLLPNDEDIEYLLNFGKQQAMIPILYRGLKKCGVPEERYKSIKDYYLKSFYVFARQDQILNLVCDELENADIPYIPLKGAVLRDLYPEKWLRTSGDLDILIHENDISRAVEIIESKTGLRVKRHNYHDILMIDGPLKLELHFSLKEDMDNMDRLLEKAWDFTIRTEDRRNEYSFTPEFQIFYITAHMAYHLTHGGLGIRQFIDLWLLTRQKKYDESTVMKMCEAAGLATFFQKSNELCRVWFEGEKHTYETARLEQFCLKGSVFNSGEDTDSVQIRNHAKSEYLFKRIFPDRDKLEIYFPKLKKGYQIPYYQMKRWMRLFKTGKMHRAADELENILKHDKEQAESIDDFLKSLGL